MGIISRLDVFLILFILIISFIGLIRGFLKELASIGNWFGSIYLTSFLKPFVIDFFLKDFTFPFLVDILANTIVFVLLIIVISMINKALVERIKKFIPTSTNSGLGFLFGFFKGMLIISFILVSLKNIYKTKSPSYLKNSLVYNITTKNDGILNLVINNLLGDFIRKNTTIDINVDDNSIIQDSEINDLKKNEINDNNEKNNFKKIDNVFEKINNFEKNIDIEKIKNTSKKIQKNTQNTDLDKIINIFVE